MEILLWILAPFVLYVLWVVIALRGGMELSAGLVSMFLGAVMAACYLTALVCRLIVLIFC